MKTPYFIALAALLGLAVTPAVAGTHAVAQAGHEAAPAAPTAGEIRQIDRAAGKVTIRHGEIAHLAMPAMTMMFGVRDKALLDGVRAGDRVRFTVERLGAALVVTGLERVD